MAEPFFRGKAMSFDEAFPEIKEITVKGTEGDIAQKNHILLNKNTLGISCSNSLCENGGYPQLGDIIYEMYRKRETSKEGIIISCKGHENMGRRQIRRCLNYLSIKIEIKYKTISGTDTFK